MRYARKNAAQVVKAWRLAMRAKYGPLWFDVPGVKETKPTGAMARAIATGTVRSGPRLAADAPRAKAASKGKATSRVVTLPSGFEVVEWDRAKPAKGKGKGKGAKGGTSASAIRTRLRKALTEEFTGMGEYEGYDEGVTLKGTTLIAPGFEHEAQRVDVVTPTKGAIAIKVSRRGRSYVAESKTADAGAITQLAEAVFFYNSPGGWHPKNGIDPDTGLIIHSVKGF
jgi:hypothetical protein